ncbi:probable fatty acid-binding protein [Sabethes cyaneus]|uniref:probable fatty acid-binding protein n=1 Tax=Sabethes cyaneus TaxID=53552 RepID=UPI00237DC7A4|nr:probable fatty acid-binding protein [Sabethes cyaneus]
MAAWVGKKYKMEKSEGFDDYMKALGVGMVLRKLGNSISPTVELLKEGDEYTFNTLSTFKNTTIKFKLGEEFEEETVDGRKVKSVCTFDGDNKLVHEQKGEKPTTIVREFTATDLTATMTAGSAKCIRYYKAV